MDEAHHVRGRPRAWARGPLWAPADWRIINQATVRLIRGHLAHGEALARDVLASHCDALDRLAAALVEHRAMEGVELAAVLADVTPASQDEAAEAVKAPAQDRSGEPRMSTVRSKARKAAAPLGAMASDAPNDATLPGDGPDGNGLA